MITANNTYDKAYHRSLNNGQLTMDQVYFNSYDLSVYKYLTTSNDNNLFSKVLECVVKMIDEKCEEILQLGCFPDTLNPEIEDDFCQTAKNVRKELLMRLNKYNFI